MVYTEKNYLVVSFRFKVAEVDTCSQEFGSCMFKGCKVLHEACVNKVRLKIHEARA